jgi:hypothetical protein
MEEDNPLENFDDMYCSINPCMMAKAVETGKQVLSNFNNKIEKQNKTKNKTDSDEEPENAEVYITLGGDSLNQSFYNGMIATLLWLPTYLKNTQLRLGINEKDLKTTLEVFKQARLPQVHDVKEEMINGNKVIINPSSTRHYSAFLTSIVSWLADGVTSISNQKTLKTNLELTRYLANCATRSFPSVPFASYHIGSVKTTRSNMFTLSEQLGKSMNWTDYMTPESFKLNEPKFVVTSENSPVVGIVGHPLSETFIGEVKQGKVNWLGLFVESEEFGKLCAQDGLTAAMIKKYIINTSPSQHFENLNKKHPIATFIEKNSLTKQCFDWRHQLSSVNVETEEDYM